MPGLKREYFILLFVLVASKIGLGQFQHREIKNNKDKDLVFPVFIGKQKIVTKKINEYLQNKFFETTTSKTPEAKLFDCCRFINDDHQSQTGYTSISYKVELNNPNILSVIFEVEGMGAYPTSFKRYFSFYSQSGEPVTSDSVFSNEGAEAVRKKLFDIRNKEIKKWIEELKTSNEASFREDSAFITDRFTDCNSGMGERDFFIGKNWILFYKEDCFPHAWGPYEIDLDITLSNENLRKYLSEYGKRILFTK